MSGGIGGVTSVYGERFQFHGAVLVMKSSTEHAEGNAIGQSNYRCVMARQNRRLLAFDMIVQGNELLRQLMPAIEKDQRRSCLVRLAHTHRAIEINR